MSLVLLLVFAVALVSGAPIPLKGLSRVLRHTVAIREAIAQTVHRVLAAQIDGALVPMHRLEIANRHALSVLIRNTNAADCSRVAHLGRRTKLDQRLAEACLLAQLKATVTARLCM